MKAGTEKPTGTWPLALKQGTQPASQKEQRGRNCCNSSPSWSPSPQGLASARPVTGAQ